MASLTRSQLKTSSDSTYDTNGVGGITATEVRTFNDDLIDSLITNDLTGAMSVASASNALTASSVSNGVLASLNSFTASATIRLNNLETTSASVNVSISNLNAATSSYAISASVAAVDAVQQQQINSLIAASSSYANSASFAASQLVQDGRLNNIESTTASLNISVTNLNASSASQEVSINALNTFTASQSTASIVTSITNLNTFSASALVSISNINSTTASLNTSVINLNSTTASLNTSVTNLNSTTASLNTSVTNLNSTTASLNTSASLALITASFDTGTRNLTFTKGNNTTFAVNIPDVSGSAGDFVTTSSFNSYTSSNDSKVNSLIAATGSYATTGSNSFNGNQIITGSMTSSLNILVAGVPMGFGNLAGTSSIAIGVSALPSNTGNANIAIGTRALQQNSSGLNNLAIGLEALQRNTTGGQNIGFGDGAFRENRTGNGNTVFGFNAATNAGNVTGNTIVGRSAANFLKNSYNTIVGETAALNITSGSNNTIMGQAAGADIGSGSNNIFIGQNAGRLISGSNNTLVGAAQGVGNWNNVIALSDGAGNIRAQFTGSEWDLTGSVDISGSLTASLAQGFTYVGNAAGRTIAVSTASFATTIDTGSFATTSSFNSYTQSTDIRLNNLETTSASVNVSISNLNSTTASQGVSITNLNASSASQQISIDALNTFSASALVSISNINTATASLFTSASLALVTASFSGNTLTFTKGNGTTFGVVIPDVSGSTINTGSFVTTSSFNAYTQSNDQRVSSLETTTASLLVETQNLELFSASALISISNINSTTASLNTAVSNINTFTQSAQISINALNTNSASVNTSITNINSATASLFTSASLTLVTASVNLNTITFTKGDGTTFPITVNTGSGAGGTTNTGSLLVTASAFINTITFTKGDGTTFPVTVTTGSLNYVTGSFGAFYDTTTQSGSAGVAYSMKLNSTDISDGVIISGSGGIKVLAAGTYDLQFSAQVLAATGADTVWIWLKKNGTNVADTSTKLVLRNNEADVAAWNFVVAANANDVFELAWQSLGGHTLLLAEAAASNYTAIPSVIATMNRVDVGGGTNLVSTSSFNSYTSSNDQKVNSLISATGSYATTGSNTFTGDQTLIDTAGNFFTISDASGSMMLVAKSFTSASAHMSASAAGIGNFIFKTNSNTADTIISGSSNLFVNAAAPTAGFKRYVGGSGNIALNASNVPQISGSMEFSPTMNNNYFGGNSTTLIMRGPVSSSTYTISGNSILGTVSIGSSATDHAKGLVSGVSMTGNQIAGTLTVTANKSNLSSSLTFSNNNLNGTLTLFTNSSSVAMAFNNINDSGLLINNNFFTGSAGVGSVTLNANNIGGASNTITIQGTLPVGTTNTIFLNANTILGGSNTLFVDPTNTTVSGTSAYHSAVRNIIGGSQLIVSASSLSSDNNSLGSAYFGRYNANDGIRNKTSNIVFAVGTGNTTTRKTGFLIDSGSNTFVEGTLNVSGATSLNGNLIITGSLTASLQDGFVYVGNASGITTTVATSSFISTINTGSFATTGSNSFNGNQTITGSVTISGSLTTAGNMFQVTGSFNTFGNVITQQGVFTSSIDGGLYIDNIGYVGSGSAGGFFIATTTQDLKIQNWFSSSVSGKNIVIENYSQTGSGGIHGKVALRARGTGGAVTVENTSQFRVECQTEITGSLIVSGSLSANGEFKLSTAADKPAGLVSVGSSGATVSNSLVTTNSIILVTTQNSNVAGDEYPAVVSSKTSGSFSINHNYGGTLSVGYLIINPA